MNQWSYTVPTDYDGCRLKTLLQNRGISTGLLRRLKATNGILVNGTPAGVGTKVRAGDEILLQLPQAPSQYIQPMDMNLTVLYEDPWLLAVEKKAGVAIHPSAGHHEGTLASGVAFYMNDPHFTFRPITRLDKYTSGVVLIAKDSITATRLCDMVAKGEIQKTYYALLANTPNPTEGTVNLPIGRVNGSVIQREVRADGKPAVTHYKVLQQRGTMAVAEVHPLTGRTHQIRVHMAAIGCPLAYDFLYGREEQGRHFVLHCGKLYFTHPHTGQEIDIISPFLG